jgi:hypothetical protein
MVAFCYEIAIQEVNMKYTGNKETFYNSITVYLKELHSDRKYNQI